MIRTSGMSFPDPSEKQAKIIWSGLTIVSIAASIGVIGGVLYALASLISHLSPILMPIAIAGILACLIDPLVIFFEKFKVPRFRAILLVYIIATGLLLGMLGTVLPAVYVQAASLISDSSGWGEKIQKILAESNQEPAEKITKSGDGTNQPVAVAAVTNTVVTNAGPSMSSISPNATPENAIRPPGARESAWYASVIGQVRAVWGDPRFKEHIKGMEATAKQVLAKVGDWLFNQFVAVTHLLGWAIGIVLIPVYVFYFLMSKKGILANWRDLLPIHHESEFRKDFIFIINSINEAMIVFFRGQILVGFISGMLLSLVLWLQGVNYSLLIGFIAAVVGVVPYLGFLLSMLLAIVVSAVQFGGDGTQVGITVGACLLVHWAEGFGYQPRIIGDRVGLHPMVIIVALFLGATLLGGLLGGLLAIPLAALIKTLMKRYVWVKYRHEVNEEPDEEEQPAAG